MRHPLTGSIPAVSNMRLLLAHVAGLELEADRLRRQGQFVRRDVRDTSKRVRQPRAYAAGGGAPTRLSEAGQAADHLAALVQLPGGLAHAR
jgi:hypothetical protein